MFSKVLCEIERSDVQNRTPERLLLTGTPKNKLKNAKSPGISLPFFPFLLFFKLAQNLLLKNVQKI
ncbi:hypothetical protein AALB19_12960 [Oscillospiraceae bacterium 50-58]